MEVLCWPQVIWRRFGCAIATALWWGQRRTAHPLCCPSELHRHTLPSCAPLTESAWVSPCLLALHHSCPATNSQHHAELFNPSSKATCMGCLCCFGIWKSPEWRSAWLWWVPPPCPEHWQRRSTDPGCLTDDILDAHVMLSASFQVFLIPHWPSVPNLPPAGRHPQGPEGGLWHLYPRAWLLPQKCLWQLDSRTKWMFTKESSF